MYCVNCSNKIKDGARFCANCGHRVDDEQEDLKAVGLTHMSESHSGLIDDETDRHSNLSNAIGGLVAIIALPIMLINGFGMILIAILLAVTGNWSVLLIGILYALIATFVISLLLLPSLLLTPLIAYFAEHRSSVGIALSGFVNLLYTFAVIALTNLYVFNIFLASSSNINKIVLLLWAYCVSIAPWSYMASKENSHGDAGLGTTSTLFFTELGLLVVVILTGFFSVTLLNSFLIFLLIMIVPLVISTYVATASVKATHG